MKRIKALFTWANALTAKIGLLTLVIILSPQAKVLLISGLMKTGMMKPPIKSTVVPESKRINRTPAILLRSADGHQISTADHTGKVLVINFWATWCPPCIAEMPSINEMYQHYNENPKVLILSIDVDNNLQKSLAFIQRNNYAFPVYNVIGEVPEMIMSGAIPTTIIIDKNGVIVARHEGAANYSDKQFYEFIDKLIELT